MVKKTNWIKVLREDDGQSKEEIDRLIGLHPGDELTFDITFIGGPMDTTSTATIVNVFTVKNVEYDHVLNSAKIVMEGPEGVDFEYYVMNDPSDKDVIESIRARNEVSLKYEWTPGLKQYVVK